MKLREESSQAGQGKRFRIFFLDGFNAFRMSWFGRGFLFTKTCAVPLSAGCALSAGLCVLGGALVHAARAREHRFSPAAPSDISVLAGATGAQEE